MKRETRANFWFIVIFLIVSLPGAVILFIKKLDPSSARFDQPEEMLTSLPYMAPRPVPLGMRWRVPPKTLGWLREITRSRTGTELASAVPPGPEWEPIISADHLVQYMGSTNANGDTSLCFLIWDRSLPSDASAFHASADSIPPLEPSAMRVTRVESISVPAEVRHELVALGFVRPPEAISWIAMEAGKGLSTISGPERFTIDCPTAAPPLHSSIEIVNPARPATTLPTS